MKGDFKLSSEIERWVDNLATPLRNDEYVLLIELNKEFIMRLKEEIPEDCNGVWEDDGSCEIVHVHSKIDKLAGDLK